MILKCLLTDGRNRCEVCSTAAGVEVLVWPKLHNQEAQNSSSVPVSRVPEQCLGSYCFMHPITFSLSLWVLLLALYSHLITFQWRHAVLFIAQWCFFIRLCLFVALQSTEGFLHADVSSATLQKDGKNVREKREKEGRKKLNDKKDGIGLRMRDIRVVELLHEIFGGKWQGLFLSARVHLDGSPRGCFSHPILWCNCRIKRETRVLMIKSPTKSWING